VHINEADTATVVEVPARALPDLITAHETALQRTGAMLDRLFTQGRVSEPWTHDPVARDIAARFNEYAVDGPTSAYSCLRLYEAEVRRVLETLRELHTTYNAAEDDAATRMRSL
jgi:hypothetical protein